VCRPGADAVCTTGLDANVQNADGSTTAQPFTPAADPPIDCFYLYPTVSQEQTQFADLTDSPEIQAETKAQVGRLSSRCRVFAPIYRQATTYGLNHPSSGTQADFEWPMSNPLGTTTCRMTTRAEESSSSDIAKGQFCCRI